MNKPLDLPDVVLRLVGIPEGTPCLQITHKKTRMTTVITTDRLNAWLLRQLRQELVSTREKT